MALAFGIISITYLFNWHYAFWGGTIIALVGFIARTNLRESTEFIDAKRRIKNTLENFGINDKELSFKEYVEEKINIKTILAYFFLVNSGSACSYLTYIYCASLLKTNFNYTALEIIKNNFCLAIAQLILMITLVLLTKKFHPLKLLKVRAIIFLICMPSSIYLLNNNYFFKFI
ncbi:putative proline/betaine transporter [Rickettsia endosymbiont of Ixodes pacificus]|uniref:hypothetical protein n=1 Tax=Rickettsia endosymbiont of Ixodes pacificus TaxID=1133329 RepID=UPI00061DF9BC|nr:hypothetical protein [Rickettsia endosymbiont of Ixodes pacificus]KJW02086.1 putative proline/betaine transporter [Rickettsia endosymbiont of Ixodes pacificus]